MAKKVAKQPPLLRIRLDPKLVGRLEKVREANDNTLTGEIASRLEDSFRGDEKIADVIASRDALATELADLRKQFLDASTEKARLEQELKDWHQRRIVASDIIDAAPELFPPQLRVPALMLLGDPRAQEETRSMFRALAALKVASEKGEQK